MLKKDNTKRLKLYPHQQRIVDLNPKKAILNWEMRTGKSLPASIWIDDPQQGNNTYIICKKQNKKDWIRMGTRASILTKEEFKKASSKISHPTAIVWDEAHNGASPLFMKGRSQLATTFYSLVKKYPECHVLLLTATPVKNNAWSLHTLLCYIGIYIDWKIWRDKFFKLEKLPFLQWPIYVPRPDWRANIIPYLEKYTDIVSLKDVVSYLPPAETKIITIKQPKYVKPKDEIVTWTHEHYHEQKNKVDKILELGYKKLMIVVYYTEQIDELAKELSKEKIVFILDGRTKDADLIKRQAQEAEECYFIVQASCGEGFDGWMFGAMIFVSMSHKSVDHIQMLGRLRHPEHLKTVEIYYLLGGRWDKRIYDSVLAGQNFNPHTREYAA